MNSPSPDTVLQCLNEIYDEKVSKISNTEIREAVIRKTGVAPKDLQLILLFLIKKELIIPDGDRYSISYEGKMFIEADGFSGVQEREQRERRKVERDTKYLKRTSLFLVIGTVGLVLVEIIRLLIEHPPSFCSCH